MKKRSSVPMDDIETLRSVDPTTYATHLQLADFLFVDVISGLGMRVCMRYVPCLGNGLTSEAFFHYLQYHGLVVDGFSFAEFLQAGMVITPFLSGYQYELKVSPTVYCSGLEVGAHKKNSRYILDEMKAFPKCSLHTSANTERREPRV